MFSVSLDSFEYLLDCLSLTSHLLSVYVLALTVCTVKCAASTDCLPLSTFLCVCERERRTRCTDQVHKRDVEEHAGGDGEDPRLHLLAGGDAQTDEEADESRERREEVPQQRPLD